MKRLMQVISFIFLSLVATAFSYGKGEKSMFDMDTKNWQTHCVGRVLIDLPPSPIKQQGKEWKRQILFGDQIEWLREIKTPEQLKKYVNAHEAIIKQGGVPRFSEGNIPTLGSKNSPRKDGKPYFIKRIERPNGGVSLLEYKNYANSYRMTSYFVSPNKFRVFRYTTQNVFTDKNYSNMSSFADQLANHLYALDGTPKESGVCIDGGFIKDKPNMPKMWEDLVFRLVYPYHSDGYELVLGIGHNMRSRPLTKHMKEREVYPIKRGRKEFRNRPLALAGRAGTEYDIKTNGDLYNAFGFATYDFGWESQPKINDSLNSLVGIGLAVQSVSQRHKGLSNYPTFTNDQEALAFWDKVLSTVRTFPTK